MVNALARFALSRKHCALWFYQGPVWLMYLLKTDVSGCL